ncbi:unnamed protein product [Miscanthus lutarioriparius]|uniref:DUF4218 domain-containing protein n=1 Tax=Miscanthus lutarioriparius TaxID=422564 RepID=A0A811SRK0_9POAL|nr:unnamed protein product [Miscanthus lutarioriparius]
MYESPQFAFVDVPTDTTNLPTSGVSRAPAVQDGMQELLQAAFFRNEMFESLPSMSEGVVDVESGFADMEQTVAEDVHPADDNAKESEQNLYERYLKDAHTSLYPGCKFSKLSFLVNLYHLKCLNGWTQESFTRLLEEVRLGGPVHYRWMYPMESACEETELSRKVRFCEGYCMEECMTFCSRFLDGDTRFNRPARNPEPSSNMKDMYMFESLWRTNWKSYLEFVDEEKGKSCPSTTLTLASIDKLIDQSTSTIGWNRRLS